MRFLGSVVVTALALWLTALVLPGMQLGTGQGDPLARVLTVLAVALILGLVNAIVRPVLSLLTLPITCLTLGLFQLVINTLMLLLTSWISEQLGLALHFDSFWWALLAGLVIGLLQAILSGVTGLGRESDRAERRRRQRRREQRRQAG